MVTLVEAEKVRYRKRWQDTSLQSSARKGAVNSSHDAL